MDMDTISLRDLARLKTEDTDLIGLKEKHLTQETINTTHMFVKLDMGRL